MIGKVHTDPHFERDLQQLQAAVNRMGGIVERQIAAAAKAFAERDPVAAERVIEGDRVVNGLDLEIDDLCVKLLALHQPAATDLRLITTALKITTDLERIGDEAVNIAERSMELAEEAILEPRVDIGFGAEVARQMLTGSLDSFVRRDSELAYEVIRRDDEVDDHTEQVFRGLLASMERDPATIVRASRVLFVAKYIERIADHATNIAEMVVFLVDGEVVRHGTKVPDGRSDPN